MLYYNYPTNVVAIDEDTKKLTETVEDVPLAAEKNYFESKGRPKIWTQGGRVRSVVVCNIKSHT